MTTETRVTTGATTLRVSIADGIAHIVLDRPDALNAMNRAFWSELPAAVADINDAAKARVIVISSTGKHFTAGMDLAVFTEGGSALHETGADRAIRGERLRHTVKHLQDAFTCLDEARMPVIAAIQGGCIGGGVDMVSACDIRYCTADAFFCIQEINIGMAADLGTFPRLCRLLPQGQVRELAYTGRRLPAAKALALGLVTEVYADHTDMMRAVMATAAEIAEKSPLAVAGSKVMINHARDHATRETLDYIGVWQAGMLSHPHMLEALSAGKEKRKPAFPDLAPLRKDV